MTDYSLMPPQVPMGQGLGQGQPRPPMGAPMAPPAPPQMPQPQQPQQPPQGAVDPNLVHMMLGMNTFAPQQAALERQQLLADKLRAGAPGLMQSQSPIHTPNWMGALASMFQMHQAGKADRDALQGLQKLSNQRADLMEKYFGAMFPQNTAGGAPGGTPGM
jgi:hypothetical protein